MVEPEPGEKFPAPIATTNDMQMALAQLLQTQRHAGHRSHEGRIHHRAMRQINNKLSITAIQHPASELFQITAV